MADNYFEKLNREHEDVLHDYGAEVSDLPIKLRSKFNNISSLISQLEANPSDEKRFSEVQEKITAFSDQLQSYLEQEHEENE